MHHSLLTYTRLGPAWEVPFLRFLRELESHGDREFFHPHDFDRDSVHALVKTSTESSDEYWLLTHGDMPGEILAYGMLRGWSAGFAIPSLGIAVCPRYRGHGIGRNVMKHLHHRAWERGASRVRLKVDRRNTNARRLYAGFGYVFQDFSVHELLGVLTLGPPSAEAA